MTTSFTAQSLQALEWNRILDLVAGHSRSAMGAERCRALPLAEDATDAQRRLQQTAEMVAAGARGEPFPAVCFPDVREIVGRAVKDAVLEPHDLRDVSTVLAVADAVARHLRAYQAAMPAVAELGAPLLTFGALPDLREQIDRCVDPDGQIRDSATPELRRLTRQAHDLKQSIRRRLDIILASTRYAEVLQERYFAQREGRYVVPVKAELQSRIPGIVHDVSSSGATVFLEPRELVELNNAIKVADREVEREVRRILHELSGRVASQGEALSGCLDTLASLDVVTARAAFSERIKGQPIAVNTTGRVALRQARHPLLVLAREQVVPNDIVLDQQVRVLVISGPNTGGKTVTLKVLGVTALMVRAGLLPACAADSEMPFVSEIFADIGDAQDLARNLSSFSAHLTQLIELLEAAPAAGGRNSETWLVLLDELATSTDPDEGAALAEAVLRHLADRGLKVIVTTHYQTLKALAQTTPGFVNASVGFDVATLSPTYRLIMGMPGGSSSIDIAGRLGLEETILERALDVLNREGHGRDARLLERMLADVHATRRRLDEERAAIARLKAEAERASQDAAAIEERLRASERDERKGVRRKLTDELMRARADVQAVLDALKRERSTARAREAKQRLAEIERRTGAVLDRPAEHVPLEALQIGDRVEIAGMGTAAVLLDAPQGKKRVRVRAGETELSVETARLVGVGPGSDPLPARASGVRSGPPRGGLPEADAALLLDVRGQTADEALERTVSALDRAALAGQPWLRVIHGHGTGRLKTAIRQYVASSPYVASFRPGDRGEGGDGVTVVNLRQE